MTAADHAHDLKTRQGGGGGFHRLEATGWTDHALKRAMICLKDVIQILRRAGSTSFNSKPSLCRRRIALGYDVSLSVVMEYCG